MKRILKKIFDGLGYEVIRKREYPVSQSSFNFCNDEYDVYSSGEVFESKKRSFLLYDKYRFSIKKGWMSIPSLRNLSYLSDKKLLDDRQEKIFNSFIGKNTITCSVSDIDDFAQGVIQENSEHFDFFGGFVPAVSPASLIDMVRKESKNTKIYLESFLNMKSVPQGMKVLDVGNGRGITTLSYAKFGFDAYGIDNNYGGEEKSSSFEISRKLVEEKTGISATFIDGDITECPDIESEYFDLIVSVSCLEHIQNIESAFSEMYRILKPGGMMFHRLNPFWAQNGGHALGILDAPWLHTMLDEQEYIEYLKLFRPFEADLAIQWNENALNRDININSIQKYLSSAGFSIFSWHESMKHPLDIKNFRPEYFSRSKEVYPEITISDLLATDVTFACIKN